MSALDVYGTHVIYIRTTPDGTVTVLDSMKIVGLREKETGRYAGENAQTPLYGEIVYDISDGETSYQVSCRDWGKTLFFHSHPEHLLSIGTPLVEEYYYNYKTVYRPIKPKKNNWADFQETKRPCSEEKMARLKSRHLLTDLKDQTARDIVILLNRPVETKLPYKNLLLVGVDMESGTIVTLVDTHGKNRFCSYTESLAKLKRYTRIQVPCKVFPSETSLNVLRITGKIIVKEKVDLKQYHETFIEACNYTYPPAFYSSSRDEIIPLLMDNPGKEMWFGVSLLSKLKAHQSKNGSKKHQILYLGGFADVHVNFPLEKEEDRVYKGKALMRISYRDNHFCSTVYHLDENRFFVPGEDLSEEKLYYKQLEKELRSCCYCDEYYFYDPDTDEYYIEVDGELERYHPHDYDEDEEVLFKTLYGIKEYPAGTIRYFIDDPEMKELPPEGFYPGYECVSEQDTPHETFPPKSEARDIGVTEAFPFEKPECAPANPGNPFFSEDDYLPF